MFILATTSMLAKGRGRTITLGNLAIFCVAAHVSTSVKMFLRAQEMAVGQIQVVKQCHSNQKLQL